MKQRLLRLSACFMAAGLTFSGTGTVVLADKAAEHSESLEGELAFARCEEYVNVRSAATTDGEVVAKMYNNDAATIIGQEGDWYKIRSGNATGYVKAEYFATGEEAQEIAAQVAYNVAVVHPDELNIRSQSNTESGTIGVAYSNQELEVVDYQGDWMKVALGDDVYGYVNAYYVDYKTYYPTAETLEEEQARLAAEQNDAEAAQAAADAAYEAQAAAEAEAAAKAQASQEAQAVADAAYEEYQNAQAAAADEGSDTSAADAQYQAYLEAQAAAEEQARAEAEAAAKAEAEAQAAEQAQAAADAAAKAEAEAAQTESAQADTTQTESSDQGSSSGENQSSGASSSTGADIASYALQFVGNPYVWGGTSLTDGADCSGFVQSVFASFGISLSRTAAAQSGNGYAVDLGSIQAGDLLFYSSGSGIDHVAIYIGGGQIVHASNPTSGITTSSAYYSTPVAAVRCW